MGFSVEWEKTYQSGRHNSVWPWSEVVSLTNRYFKGDKSGLRVLELGCGAGANIPFFAAIGAEYCGIDGSVTEVKKIQEKYVNISFEEEHLEGRGRSLVTVSVGDFTKTLPFDGEFDLVLDRSAVTHNSTVDIQRTIALAYEKLRKGGYYFGLDWFSTNFGVFSDPAEVYDIIDDYTKLFHSGYFDGLGNVHFSDAGHIQELFRQMTMIELYEKTSAYVIPEGKKIAYWSFVAQK